MLAFEFHRQGNCVKERHTCRNISCLLFEICFARQQNQ
jgi:hypothetical protein